jgi:hypothetical protein
MDDYGNLAFEKAYALCQFLLKNCIDKADFNKMIAGTQGAKLRLTTIQSPVRDRFGIGPVETPGLFDVQQVIL